MLQICHFENPDISRKVACLDENITGHSAVHTLM